MMYAEDASGAMEQSMAVFVMIHTIAFKEIVYVFKNTYDKKSATALLMQHTSPFLPRYKLWPEMRIAEGSDAQLRARHFDVLSAATLGRWEMEWRFVQG